MRALLGLFPTLPDGKQACFLPRLSGYYVPSIYNLAKILKNLPRPAKPRNNSIVTDSNRKITTKAAVPGAAALQHALYE